MWGRYYWGRKPTRGGEEIGIVVLFAWLSSQERQLRSFLDLYAAAGWASLVCHSEFLTLFFPEKSEALADNVLKELVKELKIRPVPVVFASFSGGPKGCTYKVLQLIERKCRGQLSLDEYQLVRDCLCGQIYDSSPVDFTSEFGTQFVLHPSVLKMSEPPRILSWMAKGFASGLDAMFINRFEEQRAEFWQTLYSSVKVGPILILCSEDDKLAPYPIVYNFSQRLLELGGDVNLVKWSSSPHVAHYKYHSDEYRAAVTELLGKAAIFYTSRKQLNGDTMSISEQCNNVPHSNIRRAGACSNESLRSVRMDPTDNLPSSMEYHGNQEEPKTELFHMPSVPSINPHGVLGQILFDVCVPKNIEGWDLKPPTSSNGRQVFASARRHGTFNPIKCIRRSRL